MLFRSESSSPDPLSGPSGPSIAEPRRRRSQSPSKLHFTSSPPKPRSTAKVNIHSPTKMTATSNSVLSPWRIKVVVQAEREDGEEEGTPSGRGKIRGGAPNFTLGFPAGDGDDDDGVHDSVVLPPPPKPRTRRGGRSTSAAKTGRATTVKVPVKGLSSSPEKPADDPPKVRGAAAAVINTSSKRPATPQAPRRRNSSKQKSTAGNTPKNVAAPKPAATPKPATVSKGKRAPPKKKTPEADNDETLAETAVSEDIDQHMAEAPPAPPPAPKETARTARRKSVAPTLATTRSRRSSFAPPPSSAMGTPGPLSVSKRSARASSMASNVSAARNVTPRRALSGMDPNLLLSPTPSKSGSALSPSNEELFRQSSGHCGDAPSRPLKRADDSAAGVSQPGSVRKQEQPDSFVVSEGGSMSLPDFQDSLSFPASSGDTSDGFGSLLEQSEDISEEDALADITAVEEPHADYRRSGEPDCDFTYIPDGISHTPRARKKAPSPPVGSPLFHDNPIGVETFYGLDGADDGDDDHNDHDRHHDRGAGLEDETMKSSPMLPERFAGPARAGFTYMLDNLSYTPRKQKSGAIPSNPGSQLFKDSPIGTQTFYGIPPSPSSSPPKPRDRGKGKVVECASANKIEQEQEKPQRLPKSPNRAGPSQPKDQSSPPFRVVIPTPARGLATPYRRIHDAETPDAPASRRPTDRETPSLVRVREASEIMSDALDVDEAMAMTEQRFGEGFEGPHTPESQGHSPQTPAATTTTTTAAAATTHQTTGDNPVSYPSIPQVHVQPEADVSYPSLDATGIPSPPPSQHPDRSPPTKTPEPAPVPRPEQAPAPSSGSYFARIFSPLKFRASNKSATPTASTAETPAPAPAPTLSAAPGGPLFGTPGTGRSVRFAPQFSAGGSGDRTAALEAEWAREREENIRKAQEVGAITISDTTPPTHAGWRRERSLVRRQAREDGVTAITGSEDERSYSVLDQDTVTIEEGLARHIGRKALGPPSPLLAKEEAKSKIRTNASTATNIASSRSSLLYAASSGNHTTTTTTTRGQAHTNTGACSESDDGTLADSLLDMLSQPAAASSSGLVWTKEHYRHLSAIVSSRSTDSKGAKTGYSVQLDRPGRLLAREVVAALELDGDMYLTLTPKECAAVERFLRREKAKGAEWGVTEVVRRTAGLRVAAMRRELTCKGKKVRRR